MKRRVSYDRDQILRVLVKTGPKHTKKSTISLRSKPNTADSLIHLVSPKPLVRRWSLSTRSCILKKQLKKIMSFGLLFFTDGDQR